MSPALRKLALTIHVTTSVGFLGAVAAFLALAIIGMVGEDELSARSAYIAMEMVAWSVLVPLCFASLASGVVSSLGTTWGLVRYYWVAIKLGITVASTGLLLLHMQPIVQMGAAAADVTSSLADLQGMRAQLVANAAAAAVALLGATILSTYKPKGLTAYGWRKQRAQGGAIR